MPRRRTWSDEDLATAVELSDNLCQVCDLLGVTPGSRTYEQLRRHIKRIGLSASHLPPVERARRARKGRPWTVDDLRAVVAESTSLSQVQRRLGYKPSGGMHRYFRQLIANLGLDTSHFLGQSWAKGLPNNRGRVPLSEILVENSTYKGTAKLRRRLIAEGLKEPRCEWCGLDAWLGEPLPLQLDHVNGDHVDNRLENLRILCPNCHALTPTWCRRNKKPIAKPA